MTEPRGWLAVDIETEGDPWTGRLLSIGVADPDGQGVFATAFQAVPTWVRDVLADPTVGTIEHTLYDARWLRLHGIEVNGPIADTRVMAWNVDENRDLDLESLVFTHLQRKMDKRLTANGKKFKCDDGSVVPIGEAPWKQMARYNTDDVQSTAELFNILRPKQPSYWPEQIALTSVLLDMECAGIPLDMDQLEWTRETFADTKAKIESELMDGLPPDFNLNSGDHVAAYLFLKEFELPGRIVHGTASDIGKLTKEGRKWDYVTYTVKGLGLRPTAWTDSGTRPKTDAKTLATKHGSNQWVRTYLEYQTLNKLLGTYLETLPKYTHEGRLYGTFNQAGTVSGRLSSANPNLQNQPRRGRYGQIMRDLFVGDLVIADFSQLEPRLMAHWSEDPQMLQIYSHKLDIYRKTALHVFDHTLMEQVTPEERDISKALVLSMGYGAMARKLAEILSIGGHPTTQRQAQRYLDATREVYARFFEWREETIEEARSAGYIRTLAGRKRTITFGLGDGWKAERQAVNSKIQGSAADIVNATMLGVSKIPSVRQLVQVHDELVCEVLRDPPDLEAIQYAGEQGHGFKLRVPLVFEPKIAQTWGEK